MAVAAAIVASLYFIVYHGLLKPRCHAQTVQGPRQPPSIVLGKYYIIYEIIVFISICIYKNYIKSLIQFNLIFDIE